MYAAPIGAFGAMAFTIGQYGIGTLANLAALIVTFYATALLFVLVVMCIVGGAVFSLVCRLLAMPQVWQRVGY
jgi:aerobic C4-dicarboxylate transport protein